jgi:hypothetical protein
MQTFLAYLWKEWRDHRAVLLGMALAVPLLMAVAGLTLPTKAFEDVTFTVVATLGCLAVFVFAISTDLVPGEARRGRLGFLRRQPRGLSRAFAAKFLLFSVLACVFTAYGFLTAGLTSWLVAGFFPPFAPPTELVWLVVATVLWVFAVSCCLPRGALAIPVTVGLCFLLLLPIAFVFRAYPNLRWLEWGGAWTVALWLCGGLAAGWLAFVRGRRHGGGALSAARWCGAIALVCVLPYWADAAHTAYQWRYHSVSEISSAFVGEGGDYAFVNCYLIRPGESARGRPRMSPLEPVIVDLRTGEARPVGGMASKFFTSSRFGWWRSCSAQPVVALREWRQWVVYDGRTGSRIGNELPVERARAASRAVTPYRLADGRRVWVFGDRLECDAPQGGFEVMEEHWPSRGTGACGLGVTVNSPAKFYDFDRRRFYARRDLALQGHHVRIRPGRWLVFKRWCVVEPGKAGRPAKIRGAVWQLLDPDTNTLAPARSLGPRDDVRAVLDDGRLLVRRPDRPFALVDPETGATQKFELPPGVVDVFNAGRTFDTPVRTPRGRRVFRLIDRRGDSWRQVYAYLDNDTGALVAATATRNVVGRDVQLLACVSDDEAIVLVEDRALWRVRFGTDDHEELYRLTRGR